MSTPATAMPRRRGRAGQALVIIAVATIPALLMVGMAVDGGNAYMQKRVAQSAADAASIAGTRKLAAGGTYSDVNTEITNYVQGNAGPFGTSSVLSVQWVDSAGAGLGSPAGSFTAANGSAKGVKVVTQRNFNTYFLQLIGQSQLTAQGQAASTYSTTSSGGAVGAIYALGTSGNVITMSSSAKITASSIVANSNINMSSSAKIVGPTYMTGTHTDGGSSTCIVLTDTSCPSDNPGLTDTNATVADPLASLAVPAMPATSSTNGNSCSSSDVDVLEPGRYTTTLSGSSSCTMKLNPGLYWLDAGLTLSSSARIIPNVSGGETMLYFNGGTMTLSSSSSIDLNPPTTSNTQGLSAYKGLTYFFKRGLAANISLSSSTVIRGTLYGDSVALTMSSSSNASQGQLIVKTITMSSSGSLNYNPATTGAYAVAATNLVGSSGSTINVNLVQ